MAAGGLPVFNDSLDHSLGKIDDHIIHGCCLSLGRGTRDEVGGISDEVRLRKPAPEFFTRTLSRLGIQPSEAVHLGDRLDSDIAGARAAGMGAIYLQHADSPAPPPGAPPAPPGEGS